MDIFGLVNETAWGWLALETLSGVESLPDPLRLGARDRTIVIVRPEEESLLSVQDTVPTLRPLFPDYRYHLGTLLADMGDLDGAITELQRALMLNPDYGHAALHLARAYIDRDQIAEALAVLEDSPCSDWPEAKFLPTQAELRKQLLATVRRGGRADD